MSQGNYKIGTEIEVTYQAVNCATGKTCVMDVYDETHTKDEAKSVAEMTEIGATGRYYAAFTPDAEGIWTAVINNSTDSNGRVVKQYAVTGHDVDEIGDAAVALDTLTKAAGDGDLAAMKTSIDAESGVKTDVAALNDVSAADVAAELGTYDAPTKAELDSSESNIRGADSDTLKSLSDQIDTIDSSGGAMIG